MNWKRELFLRPTEFWAKRSDEFAHISNQKAGVSEPKYGVLCGAYNVMLGNNYSHTLTQVCPECIKTYNEFK